MLKQFTTDWKLNWNSFFVLLAIQLGVFLLGVVMVCVIMNVDEDPGAWFCMGTLLSSISLVIITLFCYGFGYAQGFNVALSMGCTRTAFMGAYALRTALQLLASYGLLLLLYRLELAVYPLLFAPYGNELSFSFLTDWRWIVPIFLGLVVLALFIGSLYGRYGKKGLWFFYILWIFCCLILPRMVDVDPESTGALNVAALGLLSLFRAVPVSVWVAFAAVLAAGMVAAILRFGKTQTVR